MHVEAAARELSLDRFFRFEDELYQVQAKLPILQIYNVFMLIYR